MKNSLKIFWVEDKMVNFQYQIDQCHIDLEFHRQKLRLLDSEIGTELFSKKPEEYRRDIEWHSQKIRETKKELEKNNESLFEHMKEFAMDKKLQEDDDRRHV